MHTARIGRDAGGVAHTIEQGHKSSPIIWATPTAVEYEYGELQITMTSFGIYFAFLIILVLCVFSIAGARCQSVLEQLKCSCVPL